MKDYVWIIGGGLMQVPIIKEMRSRGFSIMVTDRDINAPGCMLADTVVQLDTYDEYGHMELAETLTTLPCAVLTDAADVGPMVSMLAEYFDLPACSFYAAQGARDKALMRHALRLEHPVYSFSLSDSDPGQVFSNWEHKASEAGIRHYPAIVKAADACATRGVTKVNSYTDFAPAVAEAIRNNHESKYILVEECLYGEEYATDWFVDPRDSDVTFVNGAKRVFDKTPGNFGIELGHTNPWLPPVEVYELANLAVAKLQIDQGPFKMDLLHDKRYGWCILECATRWSGGFDHTHTAVYSTGRELVKVLADYVLGCKIDYWNIGMPVDHCYAAAYAPQFRPGKIAGWDGIESAQAMPGIKEVIVLNSSEIGQLKNCAARPLFVIAVGPTENAAWGRAVDVAKLIKPRYA